MAVTKAQQKAVAKYESNNYDKFLIRVPKGKKEELQAHAQSNGESLNAFANRAMAETMERDNSAPPAGTPEKIQQTAAEELPNPDITREKPVPNQENSKTVKESPTSIKAFTPDAHKVIDLKRLSNDIRYQLEIGDTYGMDVLANLLSEARSIQESAIQENGGTATNE